MIEAAHMQMGSRRHVTPYSPSDHFYNFQKLTFFFNSGLPVHVRAKSDLMEAVWLLHPFLSLNCGGQHVHSSLTIVTTHTYIRTAMTPRDLSGVVDTLILWCQNLYPHYTEPGEDGPVLTYVTKLKPPKKVGWPRLQRGPGSTGFLYYCVGVNLSKKLRN